MLTSSAVVFVVLSLLHPVLADTSLLDGRDASRVATSCGCFRVNATDGHSKPSYFHNYTFLDFSDLDSFVRDPSLIDSLQDHGNEPATSSFFTHSNFTDRFSVQNWTQAKSKKDPDVSTIDLVNSPQNIYINRDKGRLLTYLTLRTSRLEKFQSAAELDTPFEMQHASLRVRARVLGESGGCAGVFFYRDDENESDIEILTKDNTSVFRATNQPGVDKNGDEIPGASTVVKIPGSGDKAKRDREEGDDDDDDDQAANNSSSAAAKSSSGYTVFNDYRLDWLPTVTQWTVNGKNVANKTYGIPKGAATLNLNMWSNGGAWTETMKVGDQAQLDIAWLELVYNPPDADDSCAKEAVVCDVDSTGRGGELLVVDGNPDIGSIPTGQGVKVTGRWWLATATAAMTAVVCAVGV